MNAPHAIAGPHAIKFTVDDFLLLKEAGAFSSFSKSELINGNISGVPHKDADGNEWVSDASIPIKIGVRDYQLLSEAGAFNGLGKTELVDGVVYAMSPQHRAHGYAKDELAYRLRRALEALGSALHVATEQSVEIAPLSEPQPDIVLTTEPQGEGPIPIASVALVVEVAVSTAAFDLGDKVRVYAGAGVPEYWVVDVKARSIRQMWRPTDGGFTEHREVPLGERVEAATIAGLAAATEKLN